MNKVHFGRRGEALAAQFLSEQGYHIVEQNYRHHIGEIDIVAREGDALCFIEVKARETDAYGHPLEAVTPSKQRTIRKVARMYLLENEEPEQFIRFDVVGIRFRDGGDFDIDLVRDAF